MYVKYPQQIKNFKFYTQALIDHFAKYGIRLSIDELLTRLDSTIRAQGKKKGDKVKIAYDELVQKDINVSLFYGTAPNEAKNRKHKIEEHRKCKTSLEYIQTYLSNIDEKYTKESEVEYLLKDMYGTEITDEQALHRLYVQLLVEGSFTFLQKESIYLPIDEHKIAVLSYKKEREEKRKEYQKKSKVFFSSAEWASMKRRVLNTYGKVCMRCGKKPPEIVLHIDHIKPRSMYPELSLEFDNLQVLCAECNRDKGCISWMDYRKKTIDNNDPPF